MQDLRTIAQIFNACLALSRAERDAYLRAIEDRGLAARARELLRHSEAARREGFLSGLPQ